MSWVLSDLQTEIAGNINYKDLDQQEWEGKIEGYKIHRRSQSDLDQWKATYTDKINSIRDKLRGDWDVTIKPQNSDGTTRSAQDIIDDLNLELQYLTQKEIRLFDKLACVCKEEQLRIDGLVTRTGLHDQTDYYIDYDNGNDSAYGEKQGNFTADSGTNTTTIVDSELDGLTITDNATTSGDWVWNVTRSAGAYVDSWDDGTDTITLVGSITDQAEGDTYYIISHWKTIPQATVTTSLSPGDRVFLRAGITWDQGTEATSIDLDDDGDIDSYISIIGCDSTTHDDWGDGSDTKPIIDFEDSAYYFYPYTDHFWWVERIDFRQGDTSFVYNRNSDNNYYKSCNFQDGLDNGSRAMLVRDSLGVKIDSCTFTNCGDYCVLLDGASVTIWDTTLTATGDVSTDVGIYSTGGSTAYLYDCTFAGTFDEDDIYVFSGYIYCRNVELGTAGTTVNSADSILAMEDMDATFEAQRRKFMAGNIDRDTTTVRSGGADSSAKMTPNANCGPNSPLVLGDPLSGFAAVWATASVQIDISVYARVDAAWVSALSAAECYAKFSYLSNAGNADRTEVESTETIANDTNWTALTSGNITPSRTGWVYLWLYLEEYEDATSCIYVDILPVES